MRRHLPVAGQNRGVGTTTSYGEMELPIGSGVTEAACKPPGLKPEEVRSDIFDIYICKVFFPPRVPFEFDAHLADLSRSPQTYYIIANIRPDAFVL